ncbi:MAG: lysylphosphatidylglycerol synthetase family protein, partial [Planctomycetes bacterium]|nr:lysylphosphatidylglycerol synthetase family protein [Planctomycetota bacterium]
MSERSGAVRRFGIRHAAPVVGTVAFVAALWCLYGAIKHYNYHDAMASFRAISHSSLATCAGLTAASYFFLTLYDYLAIRFVGGKTPYRQIATASFVGYAFSHNVGLAMITSTGIRFRLYSTWGLTASDIGRVVMLCGVTFWLGFLALGGVFLTVDAGPLPASLRIPFATARPIGLAFLVVLGGYVAFIGRRSGRAVEVHGFTMPVPNGSMTLAQIAVSVGDWATSAAAFYFLLPPESHTPLMHVMTAFLLAQVVGIVSHVPGGLGVFEFVMIACLGAGGRTQEVVGALLAFRFIHYFLPLMISALIMVVVEAHARGDAARNVIRTAARWGGLVAPSVTTLLVFCAGVLLLVSGATPGVHDRLGWMSRVLPLPVVEASH